MLFALLDRVTWEISRALRSPIVAVFHRAELSATVAVTVDGIELRCEREAAPTADLVFARVAEALQLIRDNDIVRYSWLRKSLACILITSGAGAAYWPRHRACVLEITSVLQRSAAITALSIVHELTHARVERAGIRYRPALKARIERVCIQEQIRFACRLQAVGWGMEEVLAHYHQAKKQPLRSADERHWAKLRAFEAVEAPKWIVRLYSLFRSRRG